MQLQLASQIPGDVARATEIVQVLVKYGLANWLNGTSWEPGRRLLTSHAGDVLTDQPFAVRVRMALTDLGTTFIKLGQVLSTRPDLVGPEVAEELSLLQSNTPADSPEVVTATVEKELGKPISKCFEEFDAHAMASASIGQVHRARLNNGRWVVVKVQHAGIELTIHRDLHILSHLAELAQQQDNLKRYQPLAVMREFRDTLTRELDFSREMRNLTQFRRNFAKDRSVIFPKPYPALSTSHLLTMQLLKGTSVGDKEGLRHRHIDCDQLARRGADVFVQMIFRDGFYHADPHPGNLLVMSNGRIGILDAGMVGRIDDDLRERVVQIVLAFIDRDAARLTNVVAEIAKAPPSLDRGALSSDLMDVFSQYGSQAVNQFDVGGALTAITRILHEYNLVMPSRLSMLIKCLIVLDGTARGLSVKFNLAELLAPYQRQFALQAMSPELWIKKTKQIHRDWEVLLESIPRSLTGLIDQLQSGQFIIRVKQPRLNQAASELAYGICTAALLVSSALLWIHQIPPTIRHVSILGAAGYFAAAVLATRLLWSSRWNKKEQDGS